MKNLKAKTDQLIRHHILGTMGAGLVPFFGLDLIAISTIQFNMLRELSELYEQPFDKVGAEALLCSVGSTATARVGASTLKFIPIVGTAIGGVSMSMMSGASTYALARMYVNYLEDETLVGDIDGDEASSLFKHFHEQFLNARKREPVEAD